MKNIIVISGKQYSGKDTLAEILLSKMPGFKRIGIGDAIKIEYSKKKDIPLEEIKKNKHLYRSDLIDLGNYGRSVDPDFWLKNLSNMNKIIVPDVRVLHELEFFKTRGAFLIRVESTIENRKKRGILIKENDSTETMLDDYFGWDKIIENNSSYEALTEQADKLVSLILKH